MNIVEIRKALNSNSNIPLNKIAGEYFYNDQKVSVEHHLHKTDVKLPYRFSGSAAVVYDGEIHILKDTKHYKWNGSSWTSVSTLPYELYGGSAVVYNNEIHILGGYDTDNRTNHYSFLNNKTWDKAHYFIPDTKRKLPNGNYLS